MALELTIAQAKQAPANFLYIWADEQKFLPYFGSKSRKIILAKKANQKRILALSAKKYNVDYNSYVSAIKQSFIDAYGMTPAEALVKLANGETIAGKNWSDGVYGVGAIKRNDFIQNTAITVDETTGQIKKDGVVVSTDSSAVYSRVKGKATVTSYSYTDNNGNTYTSVYNKATGKYYCGSYSTADGSKYNADGASITNADSSNIWTSIIECAQQFINWLISLFSGSSAETINSENTLPSQSDGFVTSTSTAGAGVLIAAVAAGTLLFGGGIPGLKKNKKK